MNPDACPTYEDICTFCNEVKGVDNAFFDLGVATKRDDYVLAESEHFIVVPCLGALTDWYVLIVPRRHVLSAGWLSAEERAELRSLCDEVAVGLHTHTGFNVAVFEHGSFSFRDKGGACHDHAHVHVVATPHELDSFVVEVSTSVNLQPCDDWIESAAAIVDGERRAYLALQSGSRSMIAVANNAPSAFFRKALVRWLGGVPGEDDWLVFPQTERLTSMMRASLLGVHVRSALPLPPHTKDPRGPR